MAKKISQLTQATEVKSDDVTVIVQDGETKKLPLNMMVTKQDIENKKVAGLAKLDEIEATYENDTYTPTITVENKSSVKTGEGDEVDYSANVMDGHVKSAILKGQTLVNLVPKKIIDHIASSDWDGYCCLVQNSKQSFDQWRTLQDLKPNTKYYISCYVETFEDANNKDYCLNNPSVESIFEDSMIINGVGRYQWLSTTKSELTDEIFIVLRSQNAHARGAIKIRDIMIIEYQDGMENWDIPYFEGMQSVKLPVLTTTGKNLFDGNVLEGYGVNLSGTIIPSELWGISDFICIDPERKYYLKNIRSGSSNLGIAFYDINKKFIATGNYGSAGNVYGNFSSGSHWVTITNAPRNAKYMRVSMYQSLNTNERMIYEGTTDVPYEPFKSNILTVSEDVTLRGIGDVQDTLDCLTGEVTERIGEIVLDGSEDWVVWSGTANTENISTFQLKNAINNSNSQIPSVCDKFGTYLSASELNNIVGEGVALNSTIVFIRIEKSKLTTENVNGFKQWLSQNPITVQYQLATESIKTVDLIPSGTHPSTTPYCWKDGHIQLSSSGLLPNLEYSVVTSRAGQISQNAAMIVKNDKRIFDLEILLAGGLVNTTYQALTLQNQVETGLSKVSLSSEKEPDYLLYHMIMKLIEEKAYKLDDLAEKVSVFYLYEKLSDEQFETIYSELYPFVEEEYIELPEDGEIIEEPVVDELPKEVEDEVVM